MRIIDTGITKEILTGDNHPQLKVMDKLYTVDDRKSTFDKIQNLEEKDDKKIFELALGKKETKEIMEMDLPVKYYNHLMFCLMGAITGEDADELEKRAKEQKN